MQESLQFSFGFFYFLPLNYLPPFISWHAHKAKVEWTAAYKRMKEFYFLFNNLSRLRIVALLLYNQAFQLFVSVNINLTIITDDHISISKNTTQNMLVISFECFTFFDRSFIFQHSIERRKNTATVKIILM